MHCVGARLIWQRHAPKEILLNGLLCVEGRKNDEMEITSKKCMTSNSTETNISISLDQYADIVNSFFNHTSMITIMILPIAGILRIKLAF